MSIQTEGAVVVENSDDIRGGGELVGVRTAAKIAMGHRDHHATPGRVHRVLLWHGDIDRVVAGGRGVSDAFGVGLTDTVLASGTERRPVRLFRLVTALRIPKDVAVVVIVRPR